MSTFELHDAGARGAGAQAGATASPGQ